MSTKSRRPQSLGNAPAPEVAAPLALMAPASLAVANNGSDTPTLDAAAADMAKSADASSEETSAPDPKAAMDIATGCDSKKVGGELPENMGNKVGELLRNHQQRVSVEHARNWELPLPKQLEGILWTLEWLFGVDIAFKIGFRVRAAFGLDSADRYEAIGMLMGQFVPEITGTLPTKARERINAFGQLNVRVDADARAETIVELLAFFVYGMHHVMKSIPGSDTFLPLLFDEGWISKVGGWMGPDEYVGLGMSYGWGAGVNVEKLRDVEDTSMFSGATAEIYHDQGKMVRLDGRGEGCDPEATEFDRKRSLSQVRPGEFLKKQVQGITNQFLQVDRIDVESDELTSNDPDKPSVLSNRKTLRLKINPNRKIDGETINDANLDLVLAAGVSADLVTALAADDSRLAELIDKQDGKLDDLFSAARSDTVTMIIARIISFLDRVPIERRDRGFSIAPHPDDPGQAAFLVRGRELGNGAVHEAGLYVELSIYDIRQVLQGEVIQHDARVRASIVVDYKYTPHDANGSGRPDPRDPSYVNVLLHNRLVDYSWSELGGDGRS